MTRLFLIWIRTSITKRCGESWEREKKAGVKRWRTVERNGMVMAWHDLAGRDPLFEIPEIEEYQNEESYKPTDTAFADGTLYVADGYGANYISMVDLPSREWKGIGIQQY